MAYVLHRSMDYPDELMFDEIWVDKESLEAHLNQPYIASAVEHITSILAKPGNYVHLSDSYSSLMLLSSSELVLLSFVFN